MEGLHLGDFNDLAREVPGGSVDLCLTDPPYPRSQAGPCFAMLAAHLPRLLKDGGSLVSLVPHYLLEEVMEVLRGTLKYRWVYCADQEHGPHPRMAMGIEVVWKPMLHYVKRAFPSGKGFLRDKVNIPGPEKDLHPWQQPEAWARYYIEKLTEPGDLVLDPFTGSGTVPAVCKELGRRYLGFEIDPQAYASAQERLS
jgi:DNA modification methylase